MQFSDTHVHLQDFKTRFATDIVRAALEKGVDKLVCVSAAEKDWEKVAGLHELFPRNIIPAFGLHPWYVREASAGWEERLEACLRKYPRALVGETGLDRLHDGDEEPQGAAFSRQIDLARAYGRPLIIHAVRAQDWLEKYWKILPEKFVFHSFAASAELLAKVAAHGGYAGFSFSILRSRHKERVLKAVPPDRILLETDGPYQGPEKGREVEPSRLPELARELAEVRGLEFPGFAARVYQNSLEFLNIGK